MNLFVLDEQFNRVAVVDDYMSVIWTTRYFERGDFELCVMATTENVDLFRIGRYVVRESDVTATAYKSVMIIMRTQIESDVEQGDTMIISGYDLKDILHRRIIWPQIALNSTVTANLKSIIDANVISPSMTGRAISNFGYGSHDTVKQNPTVDVQFTGQNVGEVIEENCKKYGFGYDVILSSGQFLMSWKQGEDRSLDQNTNQPVIFSEGFDNLLSSSYDYDKRIFRNLAFVAGEGEGTARKMNTYGTGTGLSRFEMFVDARDISSNNGQISATEYNKMLANRGAERLTDNAIAILFEGSIDNNVNYRLGVDYNLGDIVQVSNPFGIELSARITEIIMSDNENGMEVIPTFSYKGEEE